MASHVKNKRFNVPFTHNQSVLYSSK